MTSTPVSSLNDESLNGSWIDINSASQIHSPMGDDSPELVGPPYRSSLAESVQNIGLISFQVERFLQEAQKNQNNGNNNIPATGNQQQLLNTGAMVDNISDMYLSSDEDVSIDGRLGSKAMIESLRTQQQHKSSNSNDNPLFKSSYGQQPRLSKGGDYLVDQLSDSLSIFSRASAMGEAAAFDPADSFQDFDWLWDWTSQPEYFAGQEWKVCTPKQGYLMKQRQLYCAHLASKQGGNFISGEMMSLLFLTNILSIIIGAGLTYSILMRRSNL